MRRINLLISSLIGIVGLIIYFISVPTGTDEAFIDLTVEAGDEQILEDIYFSGYVTNQGEFYVNDEEEIRLENLSYLEQLDAPYRVQMYLMQQEYPEFIDPLLYDRNIDTFSVLNAEDYILSTHMEYKEGYSLDSENVYLNVLNKETMEIEEEEIQREDTPSGNYVEIMGMHIDYPVVQMIYKTSRWNEQTMMDESKISVGEYNIETKNYNEDRPLDLEGYFNYYNANPNPPVLNNKDAQLFSVYGQEGGNITNYLYDYLKNELIPLEDAEKYYLIGDNSQLYSLEFSDSETLLRSYDASGQEIESEITLEHKIPLKILGQNDSITAEIIDDKLHVIENHIPGMEPSKVEPIGFQIFDIQSGERLLNSQIDFETDQGIIEFIGNDSEY